MEGWAPAGFDDAVEIGRGGFGTVCRARDQVLGRIVAIKRLDAVLDERGRQRFAREGRVMGHLSHHPNVVPVYGLGVDPRGPYLVMPYLSRGSLGDRVRRGGPMPWAEAVHVMIRLAGAVESAHRAGVLHRDIKPDNVLLSDFDEPQLTDFGIARMTGEWATSKGEISGSLPYTAPEILSGAEPSARSDVYALGATLHQLLTGRAPFTGDGDSSVWQVYHRIGNDPVPPLPGVPHSVAEPVLAAMAKDPGTRPETAAAFGRALQDVQRASGSTVTDMAMMAADEDPAGTPDVDAPLPAEPSAAFGATAQADMTAAAPRAARARSNGARWLTVLGVIAVVGLAAGLVALTRPRPGADAISLADNTTPTTAKPADADPVAVASNELDVTPSTGPLLLGAEGRRIPVQLGAGRSARLRFKGRPAQRALAHLEMKAGRAQNMVFIIERDKVTVAGSTFWGSATTVGPARVEMSGEYAVVVSSPVNAEFTLDLAAAPDDHFLGTTVGGATVPVSIKPYQTGIVTFLGTAGQAVNVRWQGDDTDIIDLVLLDPQRKELARWSGSGANESEPVNLPTSGTFVVEVEPNGNEYRKGMLSVERG